MEESKAKPKPKICHFYKQGKCKKVDQCPFLHQTAPQEGGEKSKILKTQFCRFYHGNGCKNGENCKLLHQFSFDGQLDRIARFKSSGEGEEEEQIKSIARIGAEKFVVGCINSTQKIAKVFDNSNLIQKFEINGDFDCMLFNSNALFIGIKQTVDGVLKGGIQVISDNTAQITEAHQGAVQVILIINNKLLTFSQDATFLVWDYSAEKAEFVPSARYEEGAKFGAITAAYYSEWRDNLFTGHETGTLVLWQHIEGKYIFSQGVPSHNNVIMSIIECNKSLITAGFDEIIVTWNEKMTENSTYNMKPNEGISAMSIARDSAGTNNLIVGIIDGKIRILTLPGMKLRALLFAHRQIIRSIMPIEAPMAGKGDGFFTIGYDGYICVWLWK